MTLNAIITYITTTPTTWIAIFLIFTYLIDVSKLQINPWKWTGRMIRKGIKTFGNVMMSDISIQLSEVKELTENTQTEIKQVQENLNNHIAESMRRDILDFQNSCVNKRKHTKEEWTYIFKLCDKYTKHIEDNNLSNSEAEEAIKYIRHVYRDCLENGEFLI